MRHFNLVDKLICEIDVAMRTLIVPEKRNAMRTSPAEPLSEGTFTKQEKSHVAGLMRVNHAGEVSAQALYQGQALTAKLAKVKTQMQHAACEEIDHLAWCEQRLRELKSNPSLLNPLWYTGSLLVGALAGLAGDQWSLGFVAETEHQVTKHLQNHHKQLPHQDMKSKAILEKMQEDETQHREAAIAAGAAPLPFFIKQVMRGVSKLLTTGSYYI